MASSKSTTKKNLLVLVLVFAVIGGAYAAYKSFAAGEPNNFVKVLSASDAISAPGVTTVQDNLAQLGTVSVNQISAGKSLIYKDKVGLGNTYRNECYILRNAGSVAARVQVASGSATKTVNLSPGTEYSRICVDTEGGGRLKQGVSTAGQSGFNVKNISTVVQTCPNPSKPCTKQTAPSPVNVYVDYVSYDLPSNDTVSFSGPITASTCPVNLPGASPNPSDAGCSITVNGYSIQVVHGNTTGPFLGQVTGLDGKALVGRVAKVHGQLTSETTVSIWASANYFVKIMPSGSGGDCHGATSSVECPAPVPADAQ